MKIFSIESELVKNILSDDEFPYLISFPRTGSHWFRVMTEMYFGRPSLVQMFGDLEPNFLYYHTHDFVQGNNPPFSASLNKSNVKNLIYLYRNPVDTVFSLVSYFDNELSTNVVSEWTRLYSDHIRSWILNDDVSTNKIVISYDKLKSNFLTEFNKVCEFFNYPFDEGKAMKIFESTDKNYVMKSVHPGAKIRTSVEYDNKRELFKEKFSDMIYSNMDFLEEL